LAGFLIGGADAHFDLVEVSVHGGCRRPTCCNVCRLLWTSHTTWSIETRIGHEVILESRRHIWLTHVHQV